MRAAFRLTGLQALGHAGAGVAVPDAFAMAVESGTDIVSSFILRTGEPIPRGAAAVTQPPVACITHCRTVGSRVGHTVVTLKAAPRWSPGNTSRGRAAAWGPLDCAETGPGLAGPCMDSFCLRAHACLALTCLALRDLALRRLYGDAGPSPVPPAAARLTSALACPPWSEGRT